MAQIYLISPPEIELAKFAQSLELSLKTGLIPAFQLRLKNYETPQLKKISQELKKICDDHNCLFILNDYFDIAMEIGASGVHVGADDEKIAKIRLKAPENFLIGASCYDSRHLAMEAGEQGANYISFGAFFESPTKISRGKPTLEILEWANEMLNLSIVAIGGINADNCQKLVKSGADFLAVISYIWQHPSGPQFAIQHLHQQIHLN